MPSNPKSLYIHIPFCASICRYCDFTKLIYREDWAFSYIDALLKEIDIKTKGKRFQTIFIGGGTPSALPLSLLEKLLQKLRPLLTKDYEFSIEANPESLSEDFAQWIARYGVNRVSIGMESSSTRLLEAMGRKHRYEDVMIAVKRLQEAGIQNISADLIYALPNQTQEEMQEDVDALLALDIPHLSCYSYIQEDASIWTRKGIHEASQEIQADAYQYIEQRLEQAGYRHYEVSNYARFGYQCAHNKTYWRDEPYVACGLGASGYEGDIRYKNTRSLTSYLEGRYLDESETVTPEDDLTYFLLSNLRLSSGFCLDRFAKRFGYRIETKKAQEIEGLSRRGLLGLTKTRLKPTKQGMLLLDTIIIELMD